MELTEEKTFDGDLLVSQGNQWQCVKGALSHGLNFFFVDSQ